MASPDLRESYEAAVAALGPQAAAMLAAGIAEEQVARHIVAERTRLKQQWREQTPQDVLALIEARSIAQYGDVLGPSVAQLRASGKSWGDIIRSASRPGGGPPHW